MNAARRAIIVDLRFQGMSAKDAYEATKQPEFIQKWARIVEPRKKELGAIGAAPKPEVTWVTKHLQRQMEKAMKLEIEAKQRSAAKRKKDVFVSRQLKGGASLNHALKKWDEAQALEKLKEAEEKLKLAPAEKPVELKPLEEASVSFMGGVMNKIFGGSK